MERKSDIYGIQLFGKATFHTCIHLRNWKHVLWNKNHCKKYWKMSSSPFKRRRLCFSRNKITEHKQRTFYITTPEENLLQVTLKFGVENFTSNYHLNLKVKTKSRKPQFLIKTRLYLLLCFIPFRYSHNQKVEKLQTSFSLKLQSWSAWNEDFIALPDWHSEQRRKISYEHSSEEER